MKDKTWRVEGIMGTQVGETASLMQTAMNKLESDGYDVQPVIPYGGHFILIGKLRNPGYSVVKAKPKATKPPGKGKQGGRSL